jgi:hypothetical protein
MTDNETCQGHERADPEGIGVCMTCMAIEMALNGELVNLFMLREAYYSTALSRAEDEADDD